MKKTILTLIILLASTIWCRAENIATLYYEGIHDGKFTGYALQSERQNSMTHLWINYGDSLTTMYSEACRAWTDIYRPDVNINRGIAGYHGFECFIPQSLMDGKDRYIGITLDDPTPNAYFKNTSSIMKVTFPKAGEETVLNWGLGEGNGNILNDSSGLGNNGVIVNGPKFVNGKIGMAVRFNSADLNDYAIASKPFTIPASQFSLVFWADSIDSRNSTIINYGVPNQMNEVTISNPANLHVFIKGVDSGPTGVVINDNQWHAYVITWASSTGTLQIYRDGVLLATKTLQAGQTIASAGTLVLAQQQGTLGGNFNTSRAYKGDLDGFRVSGHVLSMDEAKNIYDHDDIDGTGCMWPGQ